MSALLVAIAGVSAMAFGFVMVLLALPAVSKRRGLAMRSEELLAEMEDLLGSLEALAAHLEQLRARQGTGRMYLQPRP